MRLWSLFVQCIAVQCSDGRRYWKQSVFSLWSLDRSFDVQYQLKARDIYTKNLFCFNEVEVLALAVLSGGIRCWKPLSSFVLMRKRSLHWLSWSRNKELSVSVRLRSLPWQRQSKACALCLGEVEVIVCAVLIERRRYGYGLLTIVA